MRAGIKSLPLKLLLLLLGIATAQADNFTVLHTFGLTNQMTGFNPVSTPTQGPDGTLYGTGGPGGGVYSHIFSASQGYLSEVDNINGAIFRVNPDGTGFQTLHVFNQPGDGINPNGGMVVVGDTLYGTTAAGGGFGEGMIFSINTNGTSYTDLYDFRPTILGDGNTPWGALIYSGGVLFGTTTAGGQYNDGTVFSYDLGAGAISYLVQFNGTNGANPYATLIMSGNTLFGMACNGGSNSTGTIFKVNTDGNGFSILQNFSGVLGANPQSPLVLSGNVLYGASAGGGTNGSGTIFSLNMDGSNFTNIYGFSKATNRDANHLLTNYDGINPGPIIMVNNLIYGITPGGGLYDQGTFYSVHPNGSQFAVLHQFKTNEARFNLAPTPICSSNHIYGVAPLGGAFGYGCLYSINLADFGYTNLVNYGGSDGINFTATADLKPAGQLIVTNGYVYGTTDLGGGGGYGMIFKLAIDGSNYTNLHNFPPSDLHKPVGPLTVLSNIIYGGTVGDVNGFGAGFFAMKADGSGYTNLYSMPPQNNPPTAAVVVNGTFFSLGNPFGVSLNSIGTDGQNYKSTVLSSDGSAYSITASGNILYGGVSGIPINGVCSINTNGTGFRSITTNAGADCYLLIVNDTIYGTSTYYPGFTEGFVFSVGTNGSNFTVLHSFAGPDGDSPVGPPVLVNGTLIGTTIYGGDNDVGTIFSVNTDGTGFKVRHSFTGGDDGGNPFAGLALSGNTLYGTTTTGGTGTGTVFATPAQPILSAVIASGTLTLSWDDPTYSLQSANTVTGTYTTLGSASSPYTIPISGPQQYFRLIGN